MYAQALRAVPSYVPARLHLAELEAARGDTATPSRTCSASSRSRATRRAWRCWDAAPPRRRRRPRAREIAQARARFEDLLQRHPLAFADHAAEFYLDAGADPERALHWARINLLARETRRAYTLAIRAAWAARRLDEARDLEARRDAKFDPRAA